MTSPGLPHAPVPSPPGTPPPEHPFGGVVTRGVALSIDGAAAGAIFAIGGVIVSFAIAALGFAEIGTAASLLSAGAVWVVFVIVYFIGCWATTGQTLGMRMMGLRLINADGNPPNVCRSTVRYFGRFLSILLLFGGYVLVLVHPRRRALHDVMAGTYVVYADAPPELVAAALAPEGAPLAPAIAPADQAVGKPV